MQMHCQGGGGGFLISTFRRSETNRWLVAHGGWFGRWVYAGSAEIVVEVLIPGDLTHLS